MALKIGFARKYYTVWDYSVTYRTDERGIKFKSEHYVFLRNASKDKEKAFAKYPDAEYCEDLYGRRGSWHHEKRIIDNNIFHVGKYRGFLFTACTDYNYMMWFYNNCAIDEQKENIEAVLIPEGYEVITYTSTNEKQMISPKDVQLRKEHEEREENGKAKLKKGIPFIVTTTRNLDDMGEYFVNDLEITIRFEKYKVGYYQGFTWGLPIDKKGHAKRIKNKQIFIEKYELINETTALVKEWKFA